MLSTRLTARGDLDSARARKIREMTDAAVEATRAHIDPHGTRAVIAFWSEYTPHVLQFGEQFLTNETIKCGVERDGNAPGDRVVTIAIVNGEKAEAALRRAAKNMAKAIDDEILKDILERNL